MVHDDAGMPSNADEKQKVPPHRLSSAANLLPMKKKTGPLDVRPIACSEILPRFVEQAILRKTQKEAVSTLKLFQVGVAMKDATTNVAHGCSRLLPRLRNDPSAGIRQFNIKNAFNTVDRAAILRQVRAKIPRLLPWAQRSLGGRSVAAAVPAACANGRVWPYESFHTRAACPLCVEPGI